MKVLVLNSGSSSIKFQLFQSGDWQVAASGAVTRIGETEGRLRLRWRGRDGSEQSREQTGHVANHLDGLERAAEGLRDAGALTDPAELEAVGHRVVHGGEAFHTPTVVDDDVVDAIRRTILTNPEADAIAKIAVENGMRTLREAGLERSRDGLTSIEEIMRVTSEH